MSGRDPAWPVIRGLACPFNVSGNPSNGGGGSYSFAPGAFDTDPAGVEIHLHDHFGFRLPLNEGGLRLWQNSAGLCFEVGLRPDRHMLGIVQFIRQDTGCSIGPIWERSEVEVRGRGSALERVCRRAELDHIAITSRALCAYPSTAVWMAMDEDAGSLPPRVAAIAARCAEGRDKEAHGVVRAVTRPEVTGSALLRSYSLDAMFPRPEEPQTAQRGSFWADLLSRRQRSACAI